MGYVPPPPPPAPPEPKTAKEELTLQCGACGTKHPANIKRCDACGCSNRLDAIKTLPAPLAPAKRCAGFTLWPFFKNLDIFPSGGTESSGPC